ncbi:hypothetical protein TSUD_285230 [Trifolium subterraneum]|uniref:Uncharacterized protein n=1 Tax=Trifolium subterraneum TaxID=3900 RepID=A0A2Z6NZ72_TRISU|nr:hypothetical protein TSUD_285230 [Trifolium subterraneum]
MIEDHYNGISEAYGNALMKHGGPNNKSLKVWDSLGQKVKLEPKKLVEKDGFLSALEGMNEGSPRFEVYSIDFGFGKPKKVDTTSTDKTGAFSLSENRNNDGGVEIGLVLNKKDMEAFSTLFAQGLEFI